MKNQPTEELAGLRLLGDLLSDEQRAELKLMLLQRLSGSKDKNTMPIVDYQVKYIIDEKTLGDTKRALDSLWEERITKIRSTLDAANKSYNKAEESYRSSVSIASKTISETITAEINKAITDNKVLIEQITGLVQSRSVLPESITSVDSLNKEIKKLNESVAQLTEKDVLTNIKNIATLLERINSIEEEKNSKLLSEIEDLLGIGAAADQKEADDNSLIHQRLSLIKEKVINIKGQLPKSSDDTPRSPETPKNISKYNPLLIIGGVSAYGLVVLGCLIWVLVSVLSFGKPTVEEIAIKKDSSTPEVVEAAQNGTDTSMDSVSALKNHQAIKQAIATLLLRDKQKLLDDFDIQMQNDQNLQYETYCTPQQKNPNTCPILNLVFSSDIFYKYASEKFCFKNEQTSSDFCKAVTSPSSATKQVPNSLCKTTYTHEAERKSKCIKTSEKLIRDFVAEIATVNGK